MSTDLQVEESSDLVLLPGRKGRIRYILVYFDECDSKRVTEYIRQVHDCVLRQNGMPWSMECPIVFGTFGFPFPTEPQGMAMQSAALAEISTLIGLAARVVYGSADGTLEAQAFPKGGIAPMIPYFGNKLLRLLALNPGEVVELTE